LLALRVCIAMFRKQANLSPDAYSTKNGEAEWIDFAV